MVAHSRHESKWRDPVRTNKQCTHILGVMSRRGIDPRPNDPSTRPTVELRHRMRMSVLGLYPCQPRNA